MAYLFTMDVGNTHIKMQLMDGNKAIGTFRLTTKNPRTSDEFGICVREFLNAYELTKDDILDVVISSVVPKIMYSLTSAVRKYIHKDPIIITSDINMRLAIAWAINYDGLVEAMGKGYAQRLVGPGNANFPDYNPAWADLDNYNTHAGAVDKSVVQEYLDKAGYKGETLEFIGEPGGDAVKYMQIIQSQLMMYGINVHLQNLDRTSSNKVKEDPTAWHMCQQQAASKGYLALVIGGSTWNQHEATPAYGGRSGCFIDDEELANMCDTILTTATHNQENVDKVYNYIMDNCLCCGLMSFYQNVIIPQDMTSLAMTSKNWPLHTACTFADPNA